MYIVVFPNNDYEYCIMDGAGSTVTVAHGDELGIIESSAYPEDMDFGLVAAAVPSGCRGSFLQASLLQ